MDAWLNVLIYGVIPLLTVVIISVVKRKLLRVAPVISTVLAFISYTMIFTESLKRVGIEMPVFALFSDAEWRVWCFMAMALQLIIATILTVVASGILKGKKS